MKDCKMKIFYRNTCVFQKIVVPLQHFFRDNEKQPHVYHPFNNPYISV